MANELTTKEKIEVLSREERNRAAYAAMKNALSLIDLTQNRSMTYTTYSRESLRTYLMKMYGLRVRAYDDSTSW